MGPSPQSIIETGIDRRFAVEAVVRPALHAAIDDVIAGRAARAFGADWLIRDHAPDLKCAATYRAPFAFRLHVRDRAARVLPTRQVRQSHRAVHPAIVAAPTALFMAARTIDLLAAVIATHRSIPCRRDRNRPRPCPSIAGNRR